MEDSRGSSADATGLSTMIRDLSLNSGSGSKQNSTSTGVGVAGATGAPASGETSSRKTSPMSYASAAQQSGAESGVLGGTAGGPYAASAAAQTARAPSASSTSSISSGGGSKGPGGALQAAGEGIPPAQSVSGAGAAGFGDGSVAGFALNGMSSLPASGATAVPAASASGTGELPNVSLYVGDLQPDVVEQNLFELFSSVGPVVSVRVCRDVVTRRSLGYAYVNFQNPEDAERAIDVLQFYEGPLTKNKPIRIMWKRSDPSQRRNPEGNIFIKNLDKSIDNKALYDTFSTFGKVLSCKLATDDKGNSLGYAFVHYQDANVAKYVISKMNGMLLNGQKVYVGEFRPRREREATGELSTKFTNVYVKNLDESLCTTEEVTKLFAPYGNITSIFIPTETVQEQQPHHEDEHRAPSEEASSEAGRQGGSSQEVKSAGADQSNAAPDLETSERNDGAKAPENRAHAQSVVRVRPRGFAFVNFETPEQAAAAVEALNGMELNGKTLYVGRAQKKAEREAMLRAQMEQLRNDRMQKLQDVNLFVKNLSDDVDENRLREEFSRFGTITSLRIMRDEKGVSKGFGFVAFSHPDEAIKAVTEMNQRIVGQKPIYVALAQRKDQRRAQIEAQRAAMMRAQMSFLPPGLAASMYVPGTGMPTPSGYPYPYAVHPMQMQMSMGMSRAMSAMPGGAASGAMTYGGFAMQPNMAVGASGIPRMNMTSPNMTNAAPASAGSIPMGGPNAAMLMQGRIPYATVGSQQPMTSTLGSGQVLQNSGAPGAVVGVPGSANAEAGATAAASGHPNPNFAASGVAGRAGPRQARMAARMGPASGPMPGVSMPAMASGLPTGLGAPGMGYKMGGAMRAPPGGTMAGMVAMSPMTAGAGNTVPSGAMGNMMIGSAASQPLTVQMLANADPKQQKQILGERLYPLVYQQLVREGKRELAPKITGMLLEMDNSEVLHLVESPEALQEKVEEALEVLQQHLASLQAKAAQHTSAQQGLSSTAPSNSSA
jgi:polyadenylate-binding protein